MKTNTQHTHGQETDTLRTNPAPIDRAAWACALEWAQQAEIELANAVEYASEDDLDGSSWHDFVRPALLKAYTGARHAVKHLVPMEPLDDEPDLQGGIPHEVCPDCSELLGTNRGCAFCVSSALRNQTPEPEMVEGEPADALRQAVDLCSDEIGDDIATALGKLEDARRKAPDADLQPILDQAVIEAHNAVTAGFRRLGRGLRAEGAQVAENSETRAAVDPVEAFAAASAKVETVLLKAIGDLEQTMVEAIEQIRTTTASQPKTGSSPVSGRSNVDADNYLAKGEEALATCLEVDGAEFIDDESGALLSRSLTRAWSSVRMARLELRGPKGDAQ